MVIATYAAVSRQCPSESPTVKVLSGRRKIFPMIQEEPPPTSPKSTTSTNSSSSSASPSSIPTIVAVEEFPVATNSALPAGKNPIQLHPLKPGKNGLSSEVVKNCLAECSGNLVVTPCTRVTPPLPPSMGSVPRRRFLADCFPPAAATTANNSQATDETIVAVPKPPPKSLPSILRRARSMAPRLDDEAASSSIESLPSLASSSETSDEDTEAKKKTISGTASSKYRRHTSEPMLASSQRKISFDPRIWVTEFVRSSEEKIWYTAEEISAFKEEAMKRILAYSQVVELIPTGTGRSMIRRRVEPPHKVLFTHKALQPDALVEISHINNAMALDDKTKMQDLILRVLIVDPREVCRNLFAKSFQRCLPGVSVMTAASAQEAETYFTPHAHFDIAIVEERLGGQDSGSYLLSKFRGIKPNCLLIGVSAYLEQDAVPLGVAADLVVQTTATF